MSKRANVVWQQPTVVAPGVGTAESFKAVTVTPDNLSLLLQGAEVALRGTTTSACWIGSFEFPVTGGPSNLSVSVRGFTQQPEGAHTSIFIVIGAVLKSIAFEGARSSDFTETYEATIGSESTQTITIIVMAERPAGAEEVLVSVDTIDIVTGW